MNDKSVTNLGNIWDEITDYGYKALPIKRCNFQIKNDMSKENKTIIEELFGNDFIADLSNSGHHEMPDTYQVYLNGNWIADCCSYEEAETIANREAMNGRVDIERI
jgi:hypothetical protein